MAGTAVAPVKRTRKVKQEVLEPSAMGGGLEGAERLSREMALWDARISSPDRIINTVKERADARGRDTQRNDGLMAGATQVHKDSIVGSQYILTAQPDGDALCAILNKKTFDDVWEDEFQTVVEARFNLLADSSAHWLDCERTKTLTAMVRLAIGVFLGTGELIATAEWVKESDRPYKTAMQMIRSDRLCNPDDIMDTRTLRRGIQKDLRGKPQSYWFRQGEKNDLYNDNLSYSWTNVPAQKPWGRKQVIHITDPQDLGQSRGVSDMVSVLKNIRMTKRYKEIVLQQAVVNATYAAAIESELPGEVIAAMMGGTAGLAPQQAIMGAYGGYMNALMSYLEGAKNISIDGAMMPHLFPGTKLKLQNAGTPGGMGTTFEESLLRHIAGGLGLSYEALSRDFSKTNYSSGRLAMAVQGQAMNARKRHVADSFAGDIYTLQLEEMMAAGDVPLPTGVRRDVFYAPLAKEAFSSCSWIGSGIGQIDELKETQAAILRIRAGLSTHAREQSRLGSNWKKDAKQRAREIAYFTTLGVPTSYDDTKPVDKAKQDEETDKPENETTGGNTDDTGGNT